MQVTTFLQAGMILFGLGLAALWPRNPGPLLVRESWVNLFTGAMLFPLRLGLTLAGVQLAQGATEGLRGSFSLASITSPVLQFLLVFLLLDFAKYWLHRADHRIPFLWSFHRVHHSAERLDATTGLRMHAVDFLQLTAVPITLFGLLLDISSFAAWVLPAAISMGIIADCFSHMNVNFPYSNPAVRAVLYVFNNPLFHSWHHTREGATIDGNYANALPVWDVLFGSNVTRTEPPELYGIHGDQRLDTGVIGLQLLRPRADESPESA